MKMNKTWYALAYLTGLATGIIIGVIFTRLFFT